MKADRRHGTAAVGKAKGRRAKRVQRVGVGPTRIEKR
jgi:hypothetical protein